MSRRLTTILVTGGCGFMGSHFVRHLYTHYPQYYIVNLDLLTYAGNRDNLKDVEKDNQKLHKMRYEFIKGDICKKNFISRLFNKYQFDFVVNFAAESHVDRSILSAHHFIRTNVHGAYMLIEAVRRYKVPRIIHISTDEIYGDIPKGKRAAETYPLAPTNPYAASKASADLLVQSFVKTHDVPAIIVRSSNNYGPYQYPEKLHPLVITNLIADKKIPVHGSGRHIRSWLHVLDFCQALDVIMHKAKSHSIYNIGGEEKSTLDVVKKIAAVLKKDYRKYIVHVSDRHGPDFRYSVDDSKLKKELGWKPLHSYDRSIADLVSWYIDNKTWWQKIKRKKGFLQYYKKQITGHYTFEENHVE